MEAFFVWAPSRNRHQPIGPWLDIHGSLWTYEWDGMWRPGNEERIMSSNLADELIGVAHDSDCMRRIRRNVPRVGLSGRLNARRTCSSGRQGRGGAC